jgi:hypothetical protein
MIIIMLHKVTLLKIWVLVINELRSFLKKRAYQMVLGYHFLLCEASYILVIIET